MTTCNKEDFLKKVVDFNLFYKKRRFNKTIYIQKHLDYVFKDIELKGKKLLDVGGGAGLLALYGAFKGASKSVCIEPESDGSTVGFRNVFDNFKRESGIETDSENLNETFQSYCVKTSEKFDVVVFHNSINHLNEPACEKLLEDTKAQISYIEIFNQLYDHLTDNGVVIILDCGRHNFFNDCGLKSPFATSIEWNKHQDPKTWIELMKKSKFSNFKEVWSSHEALGKVGALLLGNRFFSYFLFSHFKVVAKK
jgi:SAM-dependent methyltransferase